MARVPQDPKGYYAVLNLSPGSNEAEVRLSYTFLKNAWQNNRRLPRARIKEAYDCLSNPATKVAYDRGQVSRENQQRLWQGGVAVVVLALVLFAGFVFPGYLLPRPAPYQGGDDLVRGSDQAPLGKVIRKGRSRAFPNGLTGDAYLVRLQDGSERWYPAEDLETHYRRR